MNARRLSGLSRILAVTFGAYGFTALATVALSRVLAGTGTAPGQAVIAATLASFAIFAGVAMAAFHARTATRAWAWLIAASAPAALLLLIFPGAHP